MYSGFKITIVTVYIDEDIIYRLLLLTFKLYITVKIKYFYKTLCWVFIELGISIFKL